ncbi:MAG: VWA domain-containing protein [Defluviitaleaceae bacterium]|nr:VWA domain-containing protein [Defluviitaleaceae bacterium]
MVRRFFIAVLFVFLMSTSARASAVEGIDAILVIDTSGSMRTTDPERITLEAASLFMDMMETRSSRIGIVGFSGSVHTIMPLTPISDPQIRNNIRKAVSGFVYHGWTDIGLGLRTAAEMLLADRIETNSPAIIFFTDGRVELPDNWATNRSVELSYEDAWWAVDAVEDFTAIYTIGLDYDGTVNKTFLQEIATRTNAKHYIANDAALLPQIFNEIFASHIRSSITEVASFVADGNTYAEVFIPIPSAFVAEANIIMLSSRPIASARLFDPSGREIPLGDENFTLTSANRYTMIKILEPMVGDWLLNVRGLPEDRITVNLIYNYNVDVSMSVTQPDATDGAIFFDPSLSVSVKAGFISPLPASQIQTLFNESFAEMSVFDMENNFVESFPMARTGSSFSLDFLLDPPRDVRINISVTHPGFEQTTAYFSIIFDPELLPEPIEIPPEEISEQPPEEIPTETSAPTPQIPPAPQDIKTGNAKIFILIFIAFALVIAAIFLRAASIRRTRNRVYSGHLEMRALLADGNYTSLESPDISTFAGQMSLMEFLSTSLGTEKANKLIQSGIPIWDISLSPGTRGAQPIINVRRKKGGCHVADGSGNAIFKKKFVWEDNQQLIFSIPGESPKLEVTYRANDD